jgi:hypothetical protein
LLINTAGLGDGVTILVRHDPFSFSHVIDLPLEDRPGDREVVTDVFAADPGILFDQK